MNTTNNTTNESGIIRQLYGLPEARSWMLSAACVPDTDASLRDSRFATYGSEVQSVHNCVFMSLAHILSAAKNSAGGDVREVCFNSDLRVGACAWRRHNEVTRRRPSIRPAMEAFASMLRYQQETGVPEGDRAQVLSRYATLPRAAVSILSKLKGEACECGRSPLGLRRSVRPFILELYDTMGYVALFWEAVLLANGAGGDGAKCTARLILEGALAGVASSGAVDVSPQEVATFTWRVVTLPYERMEA